MMPPQNIFAARMGMGAGLPRPVAPMQRPVAPVQMPAQMPAQPVQLPNRFATLAQPMQGPVPAAPPLAPGASTGTPQLPQNIMQRRLMPSF